MINISESSDFSVLLSPSCIFNPYFFLWHKRGKLPKGWILTALALFYLYWRELSVQRRKLSCFVNDNEYLGMQMSILYCWKRENRMFCHSELSRNCLPGKRNQHTNKWQLLGDYRHRTTRFCTSRTKLLLLHDTTPLWKAIWFGVSPLQEVQRAMHLYLLPSQMNWCIWKVPSSNLLMSATQQILEIWWHTFHLIISTEENPVLL